MPRYLGINFFETGFDQVQQDTWTSEWNLHQGEMTVQGVPLPSTSWTVSGKESSIIWDTSGADVIDQTNVKGLVSVMNRQSQDQVQSPNLTPSLLSPTAEDHRLSNAGDDPNVSTSRTVELSFDNHDEHRSVLSPEDIEENVEKLVDFLLRTVEEKHAVSLDLDLGEFVDFPSESAFSDHCEAVDGGIINLSGCVERDNRERSSPVFARTELRAAGSNEMISTDFENRQKLCQLESASEWNHNLCALSGTESQTGARNNAEVVVSLSGQSGSNPCVDERPSRLDEDGAVLVQSTGTPNVDGSSVCNVTDFLGLDACDLKNEINGSFRVNKADKSQEAYRKGRRGKALGVLAASNDPLETFIHLRHFGTRLEKGSSSHSGQFITDNKRVEPKMHGDSRVSEEKRPAGFGGGEKPDGASSQFLRLICSSSLCSNAHFTKLLETGYEISFVERDYSVVGVSDDDTEQNCRFFADIVVDERTAIVVRSAEDLGDVSLVKRLINTFVLLQLKFAVCYVILTVDTVALPSFDILQNCMTRLNVASSLFTQKKHSYEVKLLFAVGDRQLAEAVRKICDVSLEATTVWPRDDWLGRAWILDGMSAHERFLLMFPCINSFSAQVMLASHPLKTLLFLSLEELKKTMPWIPEKCLKTFYEMSRVHFSLLAGGISAVASSSGRDSRVVDKVKVSDEKKKELSNSLPSIDKVQCGVGLSNSAPVCVSMPSSASVVNWSPQFDSLSCCYPIAVHSTWVQPAFLPVSTCCGYKTMTNPRPDFHGSRLPIDDRVLHQTAATVMDATNLSWTREAFSPKVVDSPPMDLPAFTSPEVSRSRYSGRRPKSDQAQFWRRRGRPMEPLNRTSTTDDQTSLLF